MPESSPNDMLIAADAAGALADLGITGALGAALGQTLARPTGLIVLTGEGLDRTVAAICSNAAIEYRGHLLDRAAVNDLTEVAERGLVLAIADGADAISTILNLRRLASDRFALAATLRLVLAQRVVPRLCGACRRPEQAYGSSAALLGFDPGTILWMPEGCEACGGTGYAGEVGVFEGFEIDPAMRRLIYDGADAPLLARHAYLTAPNLASASRRLARDGVIAPEDAVRVSRA